MSRVMQIHWDNLDSYSQLLSEQNILSIPENELVAQSTTTRSSLSMKELEKNCFLVYSLLHPPDLDTASISQLRTQLSVEEQARYDCIAAPTKQTEFLVSRILMRVVLSSMLGLAPSAIRFDIATYGKPFLKCTVSEQNLYFNLSHSNGYLLFAVTLYGEIGVDVETLGEYQENIARRFFHSDELNWLDNLAPSRRADGFYHLWTVKEACVKALATGVRSLHKVHVSAEPTGSCLGLWWQTIHLSWEVKAAVAMCFSDNPHIPSAAKIQLVDMDWLLSEICLRKRKKAWQND